MIYIKQDDFDEFKCIADKCPESCCLGWQIVIDFDSLEKYEKMPGPMGQRLKDSIDWKEESFKQTDRRCTMLNDDNLCDLQLSCGESALCYTCRTYPRHVEEYDGIREYSLSLSCPEVARIMIDRQKPLGFIETEDDVEDDFDDFDDLLFDRLEYMRDALYKIAQDRNLSLKHRLENILAMALQVQKLLDDNDIFGIDTLIDEWESAKEYSEDFMDSKKHFSILYDLEMLRSDWISYLDKAWKKYYMENTSCDWDSYLNLDEEFQIAGEQILMFFIYTYFCGAVYDDSIYSKAALAVYSVRWIVLMWKSVDPDCSKEGLIEMSWKYAREVEHSDLNLNSLEEAFNQDLGDN